MKNRKLSIRISEENLEKIHRKAAQAKLSLTEYVTRCCLNRQIVVIEGIDELIRQQKAIGRNLNQLTMLCNMGRVEIADLNEVKNQYAEMNQHISELLRQRWRSSGNG